ncbi:polyphosphate kinase 2 [Roseivivax sediminis]|uniref:ADP/GDP-polyphosphate phosphotransferase n=1 Tax=Roseivivax sediminis TaxID=936889 RepID=A0A1I1XIL4_9RHOB|nr:polyphosphate kinase 2 [Roseivivax sediminis]SFE07176.1 polyphosphate kinase 2, PA0141 family [Roseivivax sediminis]
MQDRDTLPFGGAISAFHDHAAPPEVRAAIAAAAPDDIASDSYPYDRRLERAIYESELEALQIELVKLQAWVKETGQRVLIVFEGRDAAGKGGTIRRFRENLNPRGARVAALAKPSETEAGQWYFQRYVSHLPAAGEIVLFDRSWYNRAVVEHVFGYCTEGQREHFFAQVTNFERMLTDDGIHLFKLWLNVGRAEQLRRFLKRERDPLKQWKLSWIDVEGLNRWEAYSSAIRETFARSHTEFAPWTLVRADDKRRTRLEALRTVLAPLPYARRSSDAVGRTDPAIVGGPDIWHG